MPLPVQGPCAPWCAWVDVLAAPPGREVLSGLTDPTQQFNLIAQASEILWNLSEHRYPGECTVTRNLSESDGAGLVDGHWGLCSCDSRDKIDLGSRWPVASATSVIENGVSLVAGTDYRIDDWQYLVRLPAGTLWPRCNDLNEADDLRVTWWYGRKPPPGGVRSAALMAAMFALPYAVVAADCANPEEITQAVREGVTYSFKDPNQMLEEGRTGLFFVDLWLAADKKGRQSRPGMFDPLGRSRRHRIAQGTDSGGS